MAVKVWKGTVFLLFFFVSMVNLASAQIAIESFSSDPEIAEPGEEVLLTIHLENVGEEDIRNILISIDLTELPFAPKDASTEQLIEEIEENEEEEVQFRIGIIANAEPGVYKIPITLSYNTTTKQSLISLEVDSPARLDIIAESDLLLLDQQGKVTLKFVNTGLTQIKVLQVTIEENQAYEILSAHSMYIGEIDPGDFETEEFILIPQAEDITLVLTLDYQDAKNKQWTEQRELDVNAYTKEEAIELGIIEKGYSRTSILIVIVIFLALAVVWKRKKRKKNAT